MRAVGFFVPLAPAAQPRARIVPTGLAVHEGSRLRCPRCSAPLRALTRAISTLRQHPAFAFRHAAEFYAKAAMGPTEPLSGPLKLTVSFVLPRPKAKTWKRKPMLPEWKVEKPDISNLLKSLEDACNGVLWHDDAQVVVCTATKATAAGDEAPGVHVRVEPAGPRV